MRKRKWDRGLDFKVALEKGDVETAKRIIHELLVLLDL